MNEVKTILYVEDDPVIQTAYQNRLQHAGFHVIPAREGLEAMKRLAVFTPDLVLLDLMLPRFNGEDVLLFIRTSPVLSKVPVIVLSANSIVDIAQEHLLESTQKRLIKSQCTPATLLAAVQEVLNGAPAEDPRPAAEAIPFPGSPMLEAVSA